MGEFQNHFAIDLTKLKVFILVVFVMISAGVVLYGYSNTITLIRLNPELGTSSSQELLRAVYTMFAGVILEVFFLVSLKKHINATHTHTHTHTPHAHMHTSCTQYVYIIFSNT